MNASTSLHISGSAGAAETLSKSLKAFLLRIFPPALNKSLSEEGQGPLLTAESRSVYNKGSTSPRCLKILSYILNVSSSSRRWSALRGKNARCMDAGVLEFSCPRLIP